MTIRDLVPRIDGVVRFQISTIFRRSQIKYIGLKQYLGRESHLRITDKGQIHIGRAIYLSDRSSIGAYIEGKVEIGDNNLFAPNVVIVDHNHNYDSLSKLICKQGYKCKSVEIGSDCWICANTVICAGAYIGDHIVVAANSVVNGRLEKPGVYGGAPAKLIRER